MFFLIKRTRAEPPDLNCIILKKYKLYIFKFFRFSEEKRRKTLDIAGIVFDGLETFDVNKYFNKIENFRDK